MRLAEQEREVITNTNMNQSTSSSIENNAKMFGILSNKIYTYKPAAIVREISCNAYDSHIEAGIPEKPFRVVLPNSLHEYFEIEDFGVGMSEEQVRTVFAAYGKSSKNDSNELIGAYGLGAKTPFAYTTSFTIQTRKDGVECLFNAFIGNKGIPEFNLLRKRDTNEPNGVKIKIPVKKEDWMKFRNEAEFILSLFPVRPEVVGDDFFNWVLPEDINERLDTGKLLIEDISSSKSELYSSSVKMYAVMGGVAYRVNPTDIEMSHASEEYTYLREVINARYFNNKAAFLKFEIGELDIIASREALSMDDEKTKNILTERFCNSIRDLIKQDEDEINSYDHPVNGIKFIHSKYDTLQFSSYKFKHKGVSQSKILSRRFVSPYGEKVFNNPSNYGYGRCVAVPMTGNLLVQDKDIIILNRRSSKTKGFVKYSRMLLKENPQCLIVSTEGEWTQHQIDRYSKYIGKEIKEVEYLEDMRERYKDVRPTKQKTTSNLPKKKDTEITARSFIIEKHNGYVQSYYENQERIDVDGYNAHKILYTEPANFNDREVVSTILQGRTLSSEIGTYGLLHDIIGDVRILLKNQMNEKSIENNKIQYFGDYLVELLEDNDNINKIEDIMIFSENFTHDSREGIDYVHSDLIKWALIGGSNETPRNVRQYYEKFITQKSIEVTTPYKWFLCNLLGRPYDEDYGLIDTNDRIEIEQNLKEKYPMLSHLKTYFWGDEYDEIRKNVTDYIQLIDSMNDVNIKKIA